MINTTSDVYLPRLLIISDNAELSKHLLDLLASDPYFKAINCELRYSIKNRSSENMCALGATAINLKDEATVKEIIQNWDVVFSLHCKQIFPDELVRQLTCINIHPGLNPFNRGWFPQIFSIINGLPAGVTIHLMDDEVDHGPIIYQQEVSITEYDTSLDVYRKIIAIEKSLLTKNFANLILGDYQSSQPTQKGNYNSISDFNALCEIDLNNVATMESHLKLLRALTHGSLKNAYFIDRDGRKCFIRIDIETEHSFPENSSN
jgi:methionyl-tRNA formyltransferase